jgi:serine/threonine protein kinase
VSQTKPAAPEPSEIAGRYLVIQKLGAGAFGTVYKAKDKVLGRMLAIKTIRLEGLAASVASLDDLLKRFEREAKQTAQLKHPNIVTVYDFGEAEGMSFLAMEFIDGVGLERIVAESGRLPLVRAAGLTAQVADALDYAHQHGVVHRDIKPANIMVEAGERVKVTDFGIARVTDSGENLTQTGGLLGTPSYMSPEQAKGKKVDGRSDLFSVGCVLYELLTGRKAFTGDNITGILFKIITDEPTPMHDLDPLLPDEVVQIVEKALTKEPDGRYQTGRELADDLLALTQPGHVPTLRQADSPTTALPPSDTPTTVAGAPTLSSPATVGRSTPPSSGATAPVPPTQVSPTPPSAPPPVPAARPRRPTPAPGRRPPARGGRGRALGIGAGLAVLALVALGTWFALGRGGPTPDTAAEAVPTAELPPTAEPAPPDAGAGGAASAEAEATPAPPVGTPTPVVARAATPPPTAAPPPPRPVPDSGPARTASGSTTAAPQPPQQAPPPSSSDAFLDELPEEAAPDGRAAGEALAQQYRSEGTSSSGFGSSGRFRRRPRIPPHSPAEQPAVRALAWILSAQNAHHRRTGSYGSLDELVKSGDLPLSGARTEDGFVRRQYSFTITAAGDTFRAEARPLAPRGRAFYVDDNGFVLVER